MPFFDVASCTAHKLASVLKEPLPRELSFNIDLYLCLELVGTKLSNLPQAFPENYHHETVTLDWNIFPASTPDAFVSSPGQWGWWNGVVKASWNMDVVLLLDALKVPSFRQLVSQAQTTHTEIVQRSSDTHSYIRINGKSFQNPLFPTWLSNCFATPGCRNSYQSTKKKQS